MAGLEARCSTRSSHASHTHKYYISHSTKPLPSRVRLTGINFPINFVDVNVRRSPSKGQSKRQRYGARGLSHRLIYMTRKVPKVPYDSVNSYGRLMMCQGPLWSQKLVKAVTGRKKFQKRKRAISHGRPRVVRSAHNWTSTARLLHEKSTSTEWVRNTDTVHMV